MIKTINDIIFMKKLKYKMIYIIVYNVFYYLRHFDMFILL